MVEGFCNEFAKKIYGADLKDSKLLYFERNSMRAGIYTCHNRYSQYVIELIPIPTYDDSIRHVVHHFRRCLVSCFINYLLNGDTDMYAPYINEQYRNTYSTKEEAESVCLSFATFMSKPYTDILDLEPKMNMFKGTKKETIKNLSLDPAKFAISRFEDIHALVFPPHIRIAQDNFCAALYMFSRWMI